MSNEGLKESQSWRSYSKELKEAAVRDYLSGDFSLPEIVRKYEISGDYILRQWITKYNSHRKLKDTYKGHFFISVRYTGIAYPKVSAFLKGDYL
ncbi:transposase [Alkalihalobacillus sp. AL-G]|uniref:transposase n=1 Tax=Alkalihalobacillus sp. AL-G TaxID=2926399 RepID=UPI00272BD5D3|nr:transposase [Alkalihalobacillus sp. AL-G]WLD93110.1 transposase [Alkalihalobacillus sp. AL-G]